MHPLHAVRVVDPTDVLWKRVGAFLLDEALFLVLVAVGARVFGGLFGGLFMLLFAIGAWLGLFVVLQGLTGASPAKHLVGLRVVDAHGRPCGPGKAAVRSVAWILDGFPYVLPLTGYAAAVSSHDTQRVGDRLAGTYVVDTRHAGAPPFPLAYPADGSAPYRLRTTAAYLPAGVVNPLHADLAAAATPAARRLAPVDGPAPAGVRAADPVFDPELDGYKRWDAVAERWTAFDEEHHEWRPIEAPAGPARPVAVTPGRAG
jgi:uncharacterized RDD family membrane protein YckC